VLGDAHLSLYCWKRFGECADLILWMDERGKRAGRGDWLERELVLKSRGRAGLSERNVCLFCGYVSDTGAERRKRAW